MEYLLLLVCIGLTWSSGLSELLARTNSSNLCSRIPLQSCHHQLKNGETEKPSSKTCEVEVANNTYSQLCSNHPWVAENVCQRNDGCGVHLEIYRHFPLASLPLYRTAFNLSLSNISSRDIKIRYRDTLETNFTFCINFTTSASKTDLFESLWYDCVFQNRLHEGHPFQLEFFNNGQYGLFSFLLPIEKDVESGQGFIYIHLHRSPQLIITFQEIVELQPNNYYTITVCKWISNICHVAAHQLVDLQNSSTFSHRFRDLVTVSLGKILLSGNVSVKVEVPSCNSQKCYRAFSSFIIAQDSEHNYVVFLPIPGAFMFITFCMVACRKKLKTCFGGKQNSDVRQSVLLVHDPTANDNSWVEAVQIFLRRLGAFDVWVDFSEIPKSFHKDPLIWYSEAMEMADMVVVLAPMAGSTTLLEQRSTIYHHTFELALELVATRISKRLKLKERNVLQHFVVLETEHCIVPDLCSSFVRFRAPDQLPKFVRYLSRTGRDKNQNCAGVAECFLTRCSSYNDSAIVESFRAIYENLQRRSHSSDAGSEDVVTVEYPSRTAEHFSLLDKEDKVHDQRRQQLDREFGPAIVSVSALPTL